MNITLNTHPKNNSSCHKPNFTAQLKGSAIKMAIKEAKTPTEIFEVAEIIENIKCFGDKNTTIICDLDGFVTVSNEKFSKIINKFKLSKNEKNKNPYLDLLKVFNTENRILKIEQDLFDSIFSHTKGLESKTAKYKLYSSYNLPVTTNMSLKNSAARHGVETGLNITVPSKEKQLEKFNELKKMFLANFQDKF